MEFLIFLLAILVFLYSLFKLSGDDHVLIRKNISLEHMFDIAFNTLWISLLFSRIYYYIVDAKQISNFFLAFFTTKGGLSLTGAMASGIIALYVIGKYRRVPLGRLFDFFTLSFLFALPVGYIGFALLRLNQKSMVPYLVCAAIYLIAAILFRKFLYPKLLNRTLKEGRISIYFFMIFPLISYASSLFINVKLAGQLSINNIVLLLIFILSIFLFIKQERVKLRRRV